MDQSESKYANRRGVYHDKIYAAQNLSQIPRRSAEELITRLYGSDERFVQGFYRYRVDRLGQTHDVALTNALQEVAEYAAKLIENLDDPHMRAIGFEEDGTFRPVAFTVFVPWNRIKQEKNLSRRCVQTDSGSATQDHWH